MEETNALRQLPEIQNIAEYLRGMEFRKKLFGGVDVESVLEHFSAVTLQYEAIISAYMRQADANAQRLAEAQALLQSKAPAPQPEPPQMRQPQPWYGGAPAYPQAQTMQQPGQPQQPYAAQDPWGQAYDPWTRQAAPQAYNPWAQQGAPVPQAPAYAWQDDAEGLPPPSFLYA